MKRILSQITLTLFCIQLFTAYNPSTNVYAANAPLTNLVENGDMEVDDVPVGWTVSSSSAGSKLEIVTDTEDSSNRVLRFDGTANTGTISFMSYSEPLANGKEYYYTYKIRIAKNDSNTGPLYAYVGINTTSVTDYARPPLSKEWVTRSGQVVGANNKLSFKVISNQGSQSSNVTKVIYEIDDIVICDMSGAEVFNPVTELNGATLRWKTGIINKDGALYARPDSTATFALNPPFGHEIETVDVNGVTVIPENGLYSVNIPSDLEVYINVNLKEDSGVPRIVSTNPKSGILNADPQNMILTVSFDRNMDISSMTPENIKVSPNASFKVEEADTEFSYNLVFEELKEATEYEVVFTENLLSDAGIAMEESLT
ncbi:MAG: Ig-like domain-containing protein, partial [Lentimicrobiaceae bacterium]|nr:Ig-like domain-containing protein [Lentimicrobiaceae bacterium]